MRRLAFCLLLLVCCSCGAAVITFPVDVNFLVWNDPAGFYAALIFAQIKNTSEAAVEGIRVRVALYDSSNRVLLTQFYGLGIPLLPNESVPFISAFHHSEFIGEVEHVTVVAQGSPAKDTHISRGMRVENVHLTFNTFNIAGRATLGGYVFNETARTVDRYFVGALLYDATGKIIGGGVRSYTWTLRPSERAPFSFPGMMYGSSQEEAEAARVEVFAFTGLVWMRRIN